MDLDYTNVGMNNNQVFDHATVQANLMAGCINMNKGNSQCLPNNIGNGIGQWPNVAPNIDWGVPDKSLPSVVRFTGTPNLSSASFTNYKPCGTFPVKRKSLGEELTEHRPKILITEEKMTAKMREMHISQDYANVPFDQSNDVIGPSHNNNDESNLHLYMCDELQNMKDNVEIVPRSLVGPSSSSTALVLWKAPLSEWKLPKSACDEEDAKSSVIITDITDSYNNEILNPLPVSHSVPIPLPYTDYVDAMEMEI